MKILTTKSTWFRDSDLRLDASFHLSEGQITAKKIANAPVPLTTLDKETSSIFSGNIFKRAYVNSPEFGYGYLTGSDMMKSDINSGKFISKKYTKQVDKLRIGKHWILVSCSGTLGNVVFTNDDFTDKIGTHDLIRIIPSEDGIKAGYLYAYLASKYGYSLLVQSSYGGVVKHIEPHHIKDLPIPLLPEKQQEEIHQLIVDAAQLRVEANRLLGEAVERIKNNLPKTPTQIKIQTGKSSIKNIINNYQKRLDSPTFINWGINILEQLQNETFSFFPLKKFKVNVFRPGIFKRIKVDSKNGLPYIKGSELSLINPFNNCEYLSKTRTPFLSELVLIENQILLTCAGTVGDVTFITKEFEEREAVGSQDIIRIESNDSLVTPQYLFAYLKMDFVKDYIQSMKYGSVIERIEPFHVEMIPIFVPTEELSNTVSVLITAYKNCLYNASQKETQAIQLIENEISTWQV